MLRIVRIAVLVMALALATAALAWAQDEAQTCTGSYIEVGYAGGDVQDNEMANDQRGLYPEDWVLSSRIFLPLWEFNPSRFELRIEDLSQENGRAWARATLWPATLEVNGYMRDSYAWDLYHATYALAPQEMQYYDAKLRFHTGELDNLLLKYEHREFERDNGMPLPEAGTNPTWLDTYKYDRMTAQYNFTVNPRIRGQFRAVSNSTEDSYLASNETTDTLTSLLKLEADLSDDWRLYGKTSFSQIDADHLGSDTIEASDMLVGARYSPNCDWSFDANYQTKTMPTDATITSRVDGLDAYGASATWLPGGGNRIEAGVVHRCLDYARLHMQNDDLRGMLRSGAVLTQADTAPFTSFSQLDQDELYLNARYNLTQKLTLISKVRMLTGDTPGTDVRAEGQPSLYYGDRLQNYHRLEWNVNGNDQLSFTHNAVEASNSDRGTDFDMRYLEGSWARCLGGCRYLTMTVGRTDAELDAETVSGAYANDDWSYAVTLSDDLPKFSYVLDYTLTDGSGWEEYSQYAVGADVNFKQLGIGPVGLRVDYFNRDWGTNPLYDTEALEFAVTYKLEF